MNWEGCHNDDLNSPNFSEKKVAYFGTRDPVEYTDDFPFGGQNYCTTKRLIQVLEKDLLHSLSHHSLYRREGIAPGGIEVPLLVCGSVNDIIVNSPILEKWRTWLQGGDELWMRSGGSHFFHYFYPSEVNRQIVRYWSSLSSKKLKPEVPVLQ